MDEKSKTYLKRALIPSAITSTLLVSIAMMTKRNLGAAIFLGVIGLPIGYVIGNAGKW